MKPKPKHPSGRPQRSSIGAPRKRSKKEPVCWQCAKPMNTPFDQQTLASGGKLCWVCKTHILMRRDELLREHGYK